MKRSIARKWSKALESGDYEQGKDALRVNNKFCCIGVLCNLHAQEHPKFAAEQDCAESYDGENAIAPEVVINWAGLNSANPSVDEELYGQPSLAELNDYGDKGFPEIAKIIRKHWKEL